MPEKVFPNDLIRYVYDETTEAENILLESVIFENEELEESFFELLHIKKELDKVDYKPSKKSIEDILEYSKSFKPEPIL